MTTVLVAGGTGMLGSRIADYLVKETGVQVRLLVRDGWEDDDAKRQRVDPRWR
jgi:nucleoside-diphosphate-sugar epimerase